MTCCLDVLDGEEAGGGGATAELVDVRRLLPAVGAVAPLNLGISNTTSGVGSYVAPVGTTTIRDATERQRYANGPGAGTTAGHRNNVQIWNRGAAGGFTMRWVVTLNTLVNNAALGFRAIVCLRAATAVIPVANPSTLTDVVGFGFDPAAAPQWSLMHNDAAGACTVVPCGAGFVANVTDLIAFEVSALRNGTQFETRAENLTNGSLFVQSVAAEIPVSTLLLSENVWLNTTADVTTGLWSTQASATWADDAVWRSATSATAACAASP